MRIFSRILLVTVNCSKVDGKMLNTPIRYSFFEFSIKIFTFWEDLRGYYLSKSGYLIIEAITISSDHSLYNNVIIICKLFENLWKILDTPTRYPFFFRILNLYYSKTLSRVLKIRILEARTSVNHKLYNNATVDDDNIHF